jgi:PAS domain S-box-containing protein
VTSPLRILLLEDDATDAELILELLQADHFVCEVTRVQTRAEFLAALENRGLDLILADYRLPSFDGLSALKLALAARPDLPFIFVSGTLGEELAIEALKVGATDYVLKTRLSRLVPSVQRALREARERAERQKAEEAARQSERELVEVIEAMPMIAFTTLADGGSVWVNRRWVEYTGLSLEDTSGAGWRSALYPDDVDAHTAKWQESLVSGEPFESEARHRSANGEYRWFLVRAVALHDEHGNVRKWYGTLTDIEERKRSEYLTGQVFDTSPDSICIIGEDYRLQRVNPVFERFWGRPAAAVVGMHIEEVIGTELFERNAKPSLDRCFAGEEVSIADWYASPRGRRYRVVTHSPLRPDSQRVEAALVIARDFTDYVQASEGLREAQTELARVNRVTTMGQLAASIAHEVNQPIAAAVTNADAGLRWLAARPPNIEEVRNAFDLIIKAGKQAGEVTGRISALIKKVPPRKATLDINETILDTIALTRGEMQRHGISLHTELMKDLPAIWGDRVQLQQVVLNLIMNAIEAMTEVSQGSRELRIDSTMSAPDGVIVAVRDSGPGLKAEIVDHLFDPFYTTKQTGLGMGLSICRSIAERHGGRLWASANAPRGAVFQFVIPLDQADAT